MIKPKLFLDADSTIFDSTKAFCLAYGDLYYNFRDFKPANPDLVNKWDFSDTCGLLKSSKEVEDIFASWNFFEHLELFLNAKETLELLKDKYDIIVVTIGTYQNIARKCEFIERELPMVSDFIGIVNKGVKMDKSVVNMAGTSDIYNTFIDDNELNLYSQDGTMNLIRYAYGCKKNWNRQWIERGGRHLKDWMDVRNKLLKEEEI